MKQILSVFITFLLYPTLVFSQNQYFARLPVGSSELGISLSEKIWITSGRKVYYTKQVGELWHLGVFDSLTKPDPYMDDFKRASFFSEDTLMISGFIEEGNKEDFIFWSGNQGKTWEKVIFGESSSIEAIHISNQKAWMSGSSQLIYYTEDKGKTWKTFNKVEPEMESQFSSIYFTKDEKTGLFGSFGGSIYKTINNCQTWEKLPTPLSQHKYESFPRMTIPEIIKIRVFGEYYIINQEGQIFITKSNIIDWKPFSQASDFEVSENGNLYTINRDLSISLYNNTFSKIWDSEKKIKNFPQTIAVKNNALFVLGLESIYKIHPKEFIESELLTYDIPIEEPFLKVEFEGKQYGFGYEDKDILCFDSEKKQWYRWMSLDFFVSNAGVFNQKFVISKNFQKHYIVNVQKNSIQPFDLPSKLLENKNIIQVEFEQGSQGCFHSERSKRIYKKKKNLFVLDIKSSSRKFLSKTPSKIKEETLIKMLETVDHDKSLKVSLKNLNISTQDIQGFKKFIDSEEKRIRELDDNFLDFTNLYAFPNDKPDFSFYKNISDSLFLLNPEIIHKAFEETNGYFSTTSNWRRILFIFEGGDKLIIKNTDHKPNYLCTPWIVYYNGLVFKLNSIKLGEQVNQITRGEFFDKIERDKQYAIFKIADYLYREKIDFPSFLKKTD